MAEQERALTTADLAGSAGGTEPAPAQEAAAAAPSSAGAAPLLPSEEAQRYNERWQSVQGSFVDRPREAVEEADRLVADLMQRLAAGFSQTRGELERQWDGQEDVSTEELRVALTRYRSFFERLLAA